jgi:acetyl-CoA carboxylase carboxyltransferase component
MRGPQPAPVAVPAPVSGLVLAVDVVPDQPVRPGQRLALLESMKMEHPVVAPAAGVVSEVPVRAGDTVVEGQPVALMSGDGYEPAGGPAPGAREPGDTAGASGADGSGAGASGADGSGAGASGAGASGAGAGEASPAADGSRAVAGSGAGDGADDAVRPDLAEVWRRHAIGLDAARPEAVGRRRASGQRTARENVDDLCDPGSFVEYGPLVVAAQRQRRSMAELVTRTPADGLLTGVGRVGGAPCVVLAYDYTVLAGTQGYQNHRKTDRMLEIAARSRLPVVLFAEGGGGRPGDTDTTTVSGLDVLAFHLFARLSGLVPLVGIASGRCFAGNAALLGCCDVVIATADSTIGMGGPAMVEGGGLGVYRPEEIGPIEVQAANGVVDVAVADEAEAVEVAKRYLSYFAPGRCDWRCADQALLRTVVPANRRQVYDVRRVVELLCDTGSVLELRRGFGTGMVTALGRIEGRAVGLVANNPAHLGGAIDRDAADKAARFLQLCDAFGLPVVSLCDTPGFMVGPQAEKTATVRHFSRLFVTGANLGVPLCTVVLRKGYGLGAQAMAGGSFRAPVATVAWPTGELGAMGLEGAVKLGFRRELDAVVDPDERARLLDSLIATAYERSTALNVASVFEIDDVIDPAETRRWLTTAIESAPTPPAPPGGKRRPFIDTW